MEGREAFIKACTIVANGGGYEDAAKATGLTTCDVARAVVMAGCLDRLRRAASRTNGDCVFVGRTEERKSMWTPELDYELVRCVEEGLTFRQIDERLGIARTTARRRLKELGLRTKHAKRKWTKEEESALLEECGHHKNGVAVRRAVAARTGRSEDAVGFFARSHGIDLMAQYDTTHVAVESL